MINSDAIMLNTMVWIGVLFVNCLVWRWVGERSGYKKAKREIYMHDQAEQTWDLVAVDPKEYGAPFALDLATKGTSLESKKRLMIANELIESLKIRARANINDQRLMNHPSYREEMKYGRQQSRSPYDLDLPGGGPQFEKES